MADQPLLENSNFRFILIDVSSESSGTPGGRSNGRSHLTSPENSNFTFILIDTYPEISGRPGGRDQVADLPLLENSNFRFILIDAYSESSGTPGGRDQVVDLTCPPQKQQFQIHTDRCLL